MLNRHWQVNLVQISLDRSLNNVKSTPYKSQLDKIPVCNVNVFRGEKEYWSWIFQQTHKFMFRNPVRLMYWYFRSRLQHIFYKNVSPCFFYQIFSQYLLANIISKMNLILLISLYHSWFYKVKEKLTEYICTSLIYFNWNDRKIKKYLWWPILVLNLIITAISKSNFKNAYQLTLLTLKRWLY